MNNIGVFAGMSDNKFHEDKVKLHIKDSSVFSNWESQTMISNNYLATRVSYLLGLTGSSININTACSTSLVAIVEACKSLAIGSCDMALSGGVSLSDPSGHGYIYNEGMIFSKDGHCRPFDEGADGTLPGMGLGVVVLKRFKEAKQDGDNIIAIIKGYHTNNDGNEKIGFTAPSVSGQMKCIISAQKMCNITSDTINYVETHGTGTKLGDPIEILALHDAFRNNSNSGTYDCFLGSVKANIGHTDSASGVAGFIKVCKMLDNKIIPPQINFTSPNKNLDLLPFKINSKVSYWETKDHPRRAGLSSFGIGGTNAHIILEEYEVEKNIIISDQNDEFYSILPISAKTHKSYTKYCYALIDYLNKEKDVELTDIAYSLQLKREHFELRNFVIAKTFNDVINKIDINTSYKKLNDPKLVFMFPGQGSQYNGMSKLLYDKNAIFRYHFDQACKIINSIKNCSFKDIIFGQDDISKKLLNETSWSQLAIFVVSFSLAKLLEYLNINSEYYIGHSLGEYVAACLSGVFSLRDALTILVKRSELMHKMKPGKMLVIMIDEQELNKILPATLEIAAFNSPKCIVISGKEVDIDQFTKLLDVKKVIYKKLNTSHAFHSKMMQKASDDFKFYLKNFIFKKPKKLFISNVTGSFISDEEAMSYEYWANHMRKPVKFSESIECVKKDNLIYLEVGAGTSLTSLVKQHQRDEFELIAVNTLPSEKQLEKENDLSEFYKSLGMMWSLGVDITWEKFNDMNNPTRLPKFVSNLPNYQFDDKEYYLEHIENYSYNIETKSDDWIYKIGWNRIKNFDNQPNKKRDIKTLVVFKDSFIILDNFIDHLRFLGENVLVISNNKSLEDMIYTDLEISINPYREEHYKELSNYLLINKVDISHIIHGWTLTDEVYDNIDYEFIKFIGMYSLYFLQKYILNKYSSTIYLSIVTNGTAQVTGMDVIQYDKGHLIGALRSLSYENSTLKTLILDLGFEKDNNILSLSNFLFNPDSYNNDPYYAKNLSQLWKEEYMKLSFKEYESEGKIEDGDVIVITGGLGGLGLSIAKEISKKQKVNFVMLARSAIGSNSNISYCEFQIDSINFIKGNGCLVEIIICDISDSLEVSLEINKIKEKFNKIDAVIHTASALPLLIKERNLESMQEAIKAKTLGAKNLLNVLINDKLKFFALTSSIDSLTGGIGIFEYCAANSFLDILCVDKLPNLNLISINWNGWENIGMNVKYHETNELKKIFKISEEDGAQIFYKLINYHHNHNRIAVSKIDLLKLKPSLFHETNSQHIKSINKSTEFFLDEENNKDIERMLAEIFYSILGQKKFSKYKSFFSLGGNSLSVIKAVNLIRDRLNFNISIVEFYSNDNVHNLANFIESKKAIYSSNEYINEGTIQ